MISAIGDRLRFARKNIAKLTLGQVHEYEGILASHLSEMETNKKQPTAETIARLAMRYKVSADYLLGLVDDPEPANAEPLPPTVREVVALARHWPDARQQELLDHARVIERAQAAARLGELDRMMAMFAAAEDGPELVQHIEELLRAARRGDTATVERLWSVILAGRGITEQRPQQAPQQG